MDTSNSVKSFESSGYAVLPIQNIDEIDQIKAFIAERITCKYGVSGSSDFVLNNAHTCSKEFDDTMANKMVLDLISDFGKKFQMDRIIYNSNPSFLNSLIGPDIVSQKNPNIVFQSPHSMRFSELHTDTPGNSPFEVVAWLPLVNCYKSKSFFIISPKDTKDLLGLYKSGYFKDWDTFKTEALLKATHLEIDYRNVLFFWSGLLHGSLINRSNESRFSLNTRFKNTYAPHGKKDPLAFFHVLNKSPLTFLSLDSL